MPRELVIAWAGRHQPAGWEEICADYRRRIARMTPVRDLRTLAFYDEWEQYMIGDEVERAGVG